MKHLMLYEEYINFLNEGLIKKGKDNFNRYKSGIFSYFGLGLKDSFYYDWEADDKDEKEKEFIDKIKNADKSTNLLLTHYPSAQSHQGLYELGAQMFEKFNFKKPIIMEYTFKGKPSIIIIPTEVIMLISDSPAEVTGIHNKNNKTVSLSKMGVPADLARMNNGDFEAVLYSEENIFYFMFIYLLLKHTDFYKEAYKHSFNSKVFDFYNDIITDIS